MIGICMVQYAGLAFTPARDLCQCCRIYYSTNDMMYFDMLAALLCVECWSSCGEHKEICMCEGKEIWNVRSA